MRVTVLVLLALALGAGGAHAYPQFQFSTGATRCGECHLEPGGGGLLTDYGRDEAGETVSGRGDGRFLHGAWTPPSWLTLGGDFRLAGGGKQLDGEPVTGLAFPMQADLDVRFTAGPVSLELTVGGNAAARDRNAEAPITAYLASREHFIGFHRPDDAWSLRAGRFFPTLGVRTQDHTAYPRRHLDMYILEEPYALEGEYHRGNWQAFASAFVGNPTAELAAGERAAGGTAYVERLSSDGQGAFAAQARVAVGDADRKVLVGAVGKRWLPGPKLLVLAEVDLQRQRIVDAPFTRYQLVGYLGVTRVMLPGYMIGVVAQRFAPDVTLRGTSRNAVELNAQAFPWAHTEAHLLLRAEATGGQTFHPGWLALFQLHYYL